MRSLVETPRGFVSGDRQAGGVACCPFQEKALHRRKVAALRRIRLTRGGFKMLSRLSSNFPRTRLAAMLAASTLFGVLSLAPSGAVLGDEGERHGGAVKLLTTVPVPGLTVFDISWIDPHTQLYYL